MESKSPIETIREWNDCDLITVNTHVDEVIRVSQEALERLDQEKVPGLFLMYQGRIKLYSLIKQMLETGTGTVKRCSCCGNSFTYKSEKAKFCSTACRVSYNRKSKS